MSDKDRKHERHQVSVSGRFHERASAAAKERGIPMARMIRDVLERAMNEESKP